MLERIMFDGDDRGDTAGESGAGSGMNERAKAPEQERALGVVETEDVDGTDEQLQEGALLHEMDRLKGEVDHLRELYLRKLAEFDNFRKRIDREREELRKTAAEDLLRELVPVLDNFERALQHSVDADPVSFRNGVQLISRQLWELLSRQGMEVIDPAGEPFDPEVHEAVQRVEGGNHPPGTVVLVLAKGYTLGGRLIRPALVSVAVGDENRQSAERPEPRPDEEEVS